MTQMHDQITTAALLLPPGERAELADRLLSSLELPVPAAIDSAWAVEVERRIDQLDRREATTIPGDVLMSQLAARCK